MLPDIKWLLFFGIQLMSGSKNPNNHRTGHQPVKFWAVYKIAAFLFIATKIRLFIFLPVMSCQAFKMAILDSCSQAYQSWYNLSAS
ncbi:MAG: hypothetical protein ACK2U1_10915 [Anaerolineales bacterium]